MLKWSGIGGASSHASSNHARAAVVRARGRCLSARVTAARHGIKGHPQALKTGPREVVVGIDLGTTNSCVAVIESGRPRCVLNPHGSTLTPSVVSFLEGGVVAVGRDAKRMVATAPTLTFSSVKRLIGRKFDDPVVQEDIPRLPYKVGQDADGNVTLLCSTVERGFIYPEEVAAQILACLIADAEEHTGGSVTKAVICVPAYFDDRQRDATISAAKLAGLETVRILREPVAAALAYGLDLKVDKTVLVFDLGGGTYDVSILEVGNGTVEVLSTGGDPHLGGDDWDAVIVDWLKKEYVAARSRIAGPSGRKAATEQLTDPRFIANMRALGELAKINLSSADEVTLRIPGGGPDGPPLTLSLTRAELDELSLPLWRRCRLPLDTACWNAGVDLEEAVGQLEARRRELRSRGVPSWKTEMLTPQIVPKRRGALAHTLLVGGATRMPSVQQFLKNMTGVEPLGVEGASSGKGSGDVGVDPDEAVALGAAVQAGVLQGEVVGLMVMDQWQASLMRALAEMKLREDPNAMAAVGKSYAPDGDDGEGEEYGEEEDDGVGLSLREDEEFEFGVVEGLGEFEVEVIDEDEGEAEVVSEEALSRMLGVVVRVEGGGASGSGSGSGSGGASTTGQRGGAGSEGVRQRAQGAAAGRRKAAAGPELRADGKRVTARVQRRAALRAAQEAGGGGSGGQ
ncbi:hypothetical protein FOA52_013510 [Chlamydomonas sp. UWO 241]|nr:hypothetical protein FOA52_013510 [Chlamydomonas sp. UWO 241]